MIYTQRLLLYNKCNFLIFVFGIKDESHSKSTCLLINWTIQNSAEPILIFHSAKFIISAHTFRSIYRKEWRVFTKYKTLSFVHNNYGESFRRGGGGGRKSHTSWSVGKLAERTNSNTSNLYFPTENFLNGIYFF